MLTPCEAMVIEYKALKCLRQGNTDPNVAVVAHRFAWLAVKRLHKEGFFREAAKIYARVIDNNAD